MAGPELEPKPGEIPVSDQETRDLRYRYHRGRRVARVRAKEESRLARYRFYIAMTVLVAIAIVFLVLAWHEIQRLFGL